GPADLALSERRVLGVVLDDQDPNGGRHCRFHVYEMAEASARVSASIVHFGLRRRPEKRAPRPATLDERARNVFYLPIALTALATTLYPIAQKSIVPGVHPMVSLVITYATQPRLGGRERDDRAAARVGRRRRLSGAPGGATRGGVAHVPGWQGPRRPALGSASASCTAWSTARSSSGPGFPSGNCELVAYTPLATTVAPRLANSGRRPWSTAREWAAPCPVTIGTPTLPTRLSCGSR